MSSIYFIRHGQASFGRANYDRLSELGRRQCRLLGEHLSRSGFAFDAVYTGALERQQDSAQILLAAFAEAGRPAPAPVARPEWNEYDSQSILSGSLPRAMAAHPEIAALASELAANDRLDLANDKRAFQRLFSRVMDLWVEGRLGVEGMESWPEFTARVNRGLDRVMAEQGAGKTVAVVTSGGPISAVMQRALSAPDKIALELGWAIVNSSFTECRYSDGKFSLASFNLTPHLAETAMVTYR